MLNVSPASPFARCLAAISLALLVACNGQPEEQFRPGLATELPVAQDMNILIISFDALRPDALGLNGYERNTSPNLDEFAQTALVFENALSSAPVTPTSFASAFTGLYPYRSFVGWQLLPNPTLAGLMSASGRHSFGFFHNVQLATERNFDQGFDHYEVVRGSDQKLLQQAKDKLTQWQDQPFFGWVHFISPHTPYSFREMSSHLAARETEGRFAVEVPGEYHVENEQELKRARDLYDGEVFFADYLFGELIGHLKALDLYERTIIVVTADHGEEFMEHGQVGHKSLHEVVTQIPMIIRHPGHPVGTRTDVPYINIDLKPTLAAIIGQPLSASLDGLDLRQPVPLPRYRVTTGMTERKRYKIAIQSETAKLMQYCQPEFSELLFDLASDPGEKNDILLDNPKLAEQLSNELLLRTQTEPCVLIANSSRGIAPEDMLSNEQIKELRSLGYIQ